MEYFDETTKEKYIPYIIESTYGLDRIVLALLFEGLHEEKISDTDSRVVLNIKPDLAPIKINVLPLIKKKHVEKARELYAITVDDTTLEQETVTVRDRDTMEQSVIPIRELIHFVAEHNLC